MFVLKFPVERIDSGLGTQNRKSTSKPLAPFKIWHVEPLLNQAQNLLDRCLADQARYDGLRAQCAFLQATLLDEQQTIVLEKRRKEEGHYRYEKHDAITRGHQLNDPVLSNHYSQMNLALSKANTDAGYSGSTSAAIHLQAQATFRFDMERAQAKLEKERAELPLGPEALLNQKLEDLIAVHKQKNLDSTSGGPLDFQHQARRLEQRMANDYLDAVERLRIASKGLREIYGYSDDFKIHLNKVEDGNAEPLETAVNWAREAVRWLAAFSQTDQSFTVTISLRSALSEADWESALKNPSVYHSFLIDQNFFDLHRYVRLRGVSASYQKNGATSPIPLCCVLKPPALGKFIMKMADGSDISGTPVDQQDMPACMLGRVIDIRLPREPEMCGSISLMNASPIGWDADNPWKVSVRRITDASLEEVEDIFLNLHVTGVPRPWVK